MTFIASFAILKGAMTKSPTALTAATASSIYSPISTIPPVSSLIASFDLANSFLRPESSTELSLLGSVFFSNCLNCAFLKFSENELKAPLTSAIPEDIMSAPFLKLSSTEPNAPSISSLTCLNVAGKIFAASLKDSLPSLNALATLPRAC